MSKYFEIAQQLADECLLHNADAEAICEHMRLELARLKALDETQEDIHKLGPLAHDQERGRE